MGTGDTMSASSIPGTVTYVLPRATVLNCGVSSRPAPQLLKRRRALKACLGCRARKVRCNVTENGSPCTNCRLDETECIVEERRRMRPRGVRSNAFDEADGHLSSVEDFIMDDFTHPSNETPLSRSQADQLDSIELPSSKYQSNNGENRRSEVRASNFFRSAEPNLTHRLNAVPGSHGCHGADDNNHRPLLPELAQDTPPRTQSPDLRVFGPRVATSGYLLPAYIQPLSPDLAEEDLEFLHRKGALNIPEPELRNALIQGFVEYMYWFMPVLDLGEFLEVIAKGDGQSGQVSLLLFQAIMFAGSAFVDMSLLKNAGFKSRRAARKALYQKVRHLYDFDSETTSASRIQALLLMTYFFNRPNEQKDLWYWMGIVISIAQTAGLYRNPRNDSTNDEQQKLRKRLWWSIFMRDQLISLGMRRPPRVKNEDHDVPELTMDDFDCDSISVDNTILPQSCTVARDPFQRRQLAVICMEKAKLCVCISRVLSSQYTVSQVGKSKLDLMLSPRKSLPSSQQVQLCAQELNAWISRLPKICIYDSATSLSGCEAHVMVVHKAILRMFYLTTLSVLYRPQVLPFSPWSTATTPLPQVTTDLQDVTRQNIRKSADEITAIAEDMQSLNLVRYLPTTAVTALLPAMMIQLLDMRAAPEEVSGRSLEHFCRCMVVMKMMHETYASAEFATEFMEASARESDVQFTRLPRFTLPNVNSFRLGSTSDESNTSASSQSWSQLDSSSSKARSPLSNESFSSVKEAGSSAPRSQSSNIASRKSGIHQDIYDFPAAADQEPISRREIFVNHSPRSAPLLANDETRIFEESTYLDPSSADFHIRGNRDDTISHVPRASGLSDLSFWNNFNFLRELDDSQYSLREKDDGLSKTGHHIHPDTESGCTCKSGDSASINSLERIRGVNKPTFEDLFNFECESILSNMSNFGQYNTDDTSGYTFEF